MFASRRAFEQEFERESSELADATRGDLAVDVLLELMKSLGSDVLPMGNAAQEVPAPPPPVRVLLHWTAPSELTNHRHYTALLGVGETFVHLDSLGRADVFWSWQQCMHGLQGLLPHPEKLLLYSFSLPSASE